MSRSEANGGEGPEARRMTIANIRELESADYVELVFLESARFYRLPRDSKDFAKSLNLLQEALTENRSLTVVLAAPNGDVIARVQN